jgi:16S rRNA (cytosine967-C5)-methyltransferase
MDNLQFFAAGPLAFKLLASRGRLCDWVAMARRSIPPPEPAGLAARRAAADILDGVLRRNRPLDEQLDGKQAQPNLTALAGRDRALARRLVATALRRLGTLRHLLGLFLPQGLPAGAPRVETALLLGATQILWLEIPDHAAVDLSVRIAQADRRAGHYSGLVNAVLRRVAREGKERLADVDTVALDTPPWLLARWARAYGAETARDIAIANAHEPPLDLTVKSEAESWAARLRGRITQTGTLRTVVQGQISLLPGFSEGAWWVQDAAAALPVRLLGNVQGLRVADLCAPPGGKTAQLAYAGAQVTAVDRSDLRLNRLRENLARLALQAEIVAADATEWTAEPFDAILLDAPCSSTGTIRRHPDVPWLKGEADILAMAALQQRLLDHAATLLKPGGTLVYCTCSLEPEEGVDVVTGFLQRAAGFRRRPVTADEVCGLAEFLTPAGDLRTLPCHLPDADPRLAGLDGFYAARLERL